MSFTIVLYALLISSGMDTETPDEFLQILASSNVETWIEHQFTGNSHDGILPDSITSIIGSKRSLSVEPGEKILEDVEGGYRVIYPLTRWTWRMDGGRIGSVCGESIIEWHPGGYTWVVIPFMVDEGTSIGRKESICMGITITASIALIGIIAVWYAKRRYG